MKMFKYLKEKSQRRKEFKSKDGDNQSSDDCGRDICGFPVATAADGDDSSATAQQVCDQLLDEVLPLYEKQSQLKGTKTDQRVNEKEQQKNSDDDTDSLEDGERSFFRYDSRLSFTLQAIVRHPTCLSHFVQFLEQRSEDALPLLKFHLDTENFRLAAQTAQRRWRRRCSTSTSMEGLCHGPPSCPAQLEQEQEYCCPATVPELRTLCDLSMGKPLTDDEKSQICAAAATNNKQQKTPPNGANTTSLLENKKRTKKVQENREPDESGCSGPEKPLAAASVRDAIAIYQKYLSVDAQPRIILPVGVLAHISLLLCQRHGDEGDGTPADDDDAVDIAERTSASLTSAHEEPRCISADCFVTAQRYVLQRLECEHLNAFLDSGFYGQYCIELIERSMTTTTEDGKTSMAESASSRRRRRSVVSIGGVVATGGGGEAPLNILDVLHSEVALFFFMEFLERRQERDCLDFWTAAINYRRGCGATGMKAASRQADAMVIYERFFSLLRQAHAAEQGAAEDPAVNRSQQRPPTVCRLFLDARLRTHVEERICAVDEDEDDDDDELNTNADADESGSAATALARCFDVPLRLMALYLERRHLASFLQSTLFRRYLDELRAKVQPHGLMSSDMSATMAVASLAEAPRRLHRKTLSDCTDSAQPATTNTLLAMDSSRCRGQRQLARAASIHAPATAATMAAVARGTSLNIDSRQLTQPDLLWRRSTSICGALDGYSGGGAGGLKFGHVNALGRYERDFPTADAAQQPTSLAGVGNRSLSSWSLSGAGVNTVGGAVSQPSAAGGSGGGAGQRLKSVMRRWMHLREEDQLQEEIAWQVAEMIVRDVTSVTLAGSSGKPPSAL